MLAILGAWRYHSTLPVGLAYVALLTWLGDHHRWKEPTEAMFTIA